MNLADRTTTFPNRESWLAGRGKGIGGSDVAAILGLSPWNAPLSLWMKKVGVIIDDSPASDEMVWGSKVEGAIIADISEQAGVGLSATPWTIIRDAEYPDLFCSPDGLGGPDEPTCADFLVEVKNAHFAKADDWSEGLPPYYVPQVQHALHVSGLPRALVGASVGGRRPNFCWVERDPAWWETNSPKILDFLRRIRDEDPPPPSAHDADKEALGEMYPSEAKGHVIALPADAVDWTSELKDIAATKKQIEARESELKNLIRAAVGENEEGIVPGGLGRWRWATVDVAAHAVKAQHYRKLTHVKGGR